MTFQRIPELKEDFVRREIESEFRRRDFYHKICGDLEQKLPAT